LKSQMSATQLKENWMARRSRQIILVLMMIAFCLFVSGCGDKTVSALTSDDIVISSFSEEFVSYLKVPLGTSAEMIGLPDTIQATIVISQNELQAEDASEQTFEIIEYMDVPVSWLCEDYDPNTVGVSIFSAVLQSGFSYEGVIPTVQVEVEAAVESEPTITPDPSTTPELIVTPEPSTSPEGSPTPEPALEYVIVSFVNEPIELIVERGITEENLPLPATLPALNALGEQIEVPVTWVCENVGDNPLEIAENQYAFASRYGYGPWVFIAQIGTAEVAASDDGIGDDVVDPDAALLAGTQTFVYTGEPVTANVSILGCTEIENFCGTSDDGLVMRFAILAGDSIHLSDSIGAFMADGGYQNVPITWNGRYDTNVAGNYMLEIVLGHGYHGGGRAFAEIVVLEAGADSSEDSAVDFD